MDGEEDDERARAALEAMQAQLQGSEAALKENAQHLGSLDQRG
jgi:hypothetical protein